LILGISELFLWFFIGDKLERLVSDPISNFEFFANCQTILSSLKLPIDRIPPPPKADPNAFALSECKLPKAFCQLFHSDEQSALPAIRHVVLELRKMTTEVSPSLIAFRLFQALEWLVSCLSGKGEVIGADETFQFFVAAVADAKLFNWPTVLTMIEQFAVEDLKSSKISFVIAQLRIAVQFIRSRMVAVPPVVLLPFQQLKDFTPIDDVAVEFRGLAVYAFPLWDNSPFPAGVCCTGNQRDVIKLWRYELKGRMFECDVQAVGTESGTILVLSQEEIERKRLILVDTLPFVDATEEVALVSNLSLLCAKAKGKRLATSMIEELLEEFAVQWEIRKDQARPGVFEVIGDLQENLKILGVLPNEFIVNGKFDIRTFEGIKKVGVKLPQGNFFLDRTIVNQIALKVNEVLRRVV
jgi:hypothetical protein